MLEGGIHNYLEWAKESNTRSLFLGKNYVFDSRLLLGIENTPVIGECKYCSEKSENYLKCVGQFCHLMVICCEICFNLQKVGDGVHCCIECKRNHKEMDCEQIKRTECECERTRRALLK